jgi:hypothetical protein
MTYLTDKALALYISATTLELSERVKDEEGQVAAEYMGLVALAAFIIFALLKTTHIDTVISETVVKLVGAIAKGDNPAEIE